MTKRRKGPYQPRWEDGQTVGEGRRDAESRYEAVAPHIGRGSTVLDLGSEVGYFSHRLADERGCFCVAVDPDAEWQDRVVAVRQKLSLAEFRTLARLTNADVILALSILHHVHPWREWLDAITHHADAVFIEVPVPGEQLGSASPERIEEIHRHVLGLGDVLCETGSVYDPELLRPTVKVTP